MWYKLVHLFCYHTSCVHTWHDMTPLLLYDACVWEWSSNVEPGILCSRSDVKPAVSKWRLTVNVGHLLWLDSGTETYSLMETISQTWFVWSNWRTMWIYYLAIHSLSCVTRQDLQGTIYMVDESYMESFSGTTSGIRTNTPDARS